MTETGVAGALVGGLPENRRVPKPLRVVVRPPILAPPWRLRCDLDADPLTLYTVQSAEAADELFATGELRGRVETEDEVFADPYVWMSARMTELLGAHGEGDGMLWLWAKEKRSCLASALKADPPGSVLLTVSIARERVLLSDFGAWHSVLNRSLELPASPGESVDDWWSRAEPVLDEWHDRADEYRGQPLELWPSELREELERSWLPIVSPGPRATSTHVQATTRVIRRNDVVRAVRIR